jgi:N-acetylglucosaminyldiphosphoundecaprenol N-acetyl-beta-D-mannosaminyltransferase
VCICDRDPKFRETYSDACLALPDGMPIILASRVLGRPLRQKLSGSDMVPALCSFAAREGFSVYFLGGTPGTAEDTAQIMAQRNPGLRVAGHFCPDYGFEKDPAEIARINEIVAAAQADICFVALGSPKQELWMHANYLPAGAMIYMGVGATFDFISGRVRRAPRIVQKAGFEWLWRVAMEPRRLWRRYLVEDLVFFRIFWREFLARKRHAAPR